MSFFVLIHGGGHGRWCWFKVIPHLERLGHTVVAIDLPGHGQDPTPPSAVTLGDLVGRIQETIQNFDEQAVLVGHSFGGIPVTAVAEQCPEKLERLVYLSAFLLPSNVSASEFQDNRMRKLASKKLVRDEHAGTVSIRDTALREYYYSDCSDEDIALAELLITPSPVGPMEEPIATSDENFGEIPKTYIKCENDRAVPLWFQEKMFTRTPCEEIISLDADHSSFFSNPERLSKILSRTS